ncbi:FecR family protein [Chitinophaga skermanii]|uniref:FecR family protein n=1 Tax=Chitinophaga skermanii TaxID=331697 RepID=A0A327RA46_9BACT|nr:FecR domain-containing protein [Chitinophaga skermanii]RAJ10787.1 FecR family protein [Chitinophaga skermanii]
MFDSLQGDELYALLCKYLLDESTEEERAWVNAWRVADANNESILTGIQKVINTPLATPVTNTEAAWEQLYTAIGRPSYNEAPLTVAHKKPLRAWMRIAAILVVILGTTLVWRLLQQDEPTVLSGPLHTNLADGTVIDLGENGHLTPVKSFNKKHRAVHFRGHGVFDIAQNDQYPFVIHLDSIEVKVLGTRFTIDYHPDSAIMIHVDAGKVLVINHNTDDSIVLTQGMILRAENELDKFDVAGNVVDVDKKKLTFKDIPLSSVAQTIRTVYKVDIQLQDSSLFKIPISATFENESMDNIIASITFMTNLVAEKNGQLGYRIYRK